jgi:hypothetical protein
MILGLVLLYRVSYGVEYTFDKDEDMLKQMLPFFISKTKYDKIVKGDKKKYKQKKLYLNTLNKLFPHLILLIEK